MSPRSQPPAFEDGIDVLVEFRVCLLYTSLHEVVSRQRDEDQSAAAAQSTECLLERLWCDSHRDGRMRAAEGLNHLHREMCIRDRS